MDRGTKSVAVVALLLISICSLLPPRKADVPENPTRFQYVNANQAGLPAVPRGFLFYGVNQALVPVVGRYQAGPQSKKIESVASISCRVDVGRLVAEIAFLASIALAAVLFFTKSGTELRRR